MDQQDTCSATSFVQLIILTSVKLITHFQLVKLSETSCSVHLIRYWRFSKKEFSCSASIHEQDVIGLLNQVGFIFLWQRLVDSFSLVVEEIGNEVQIFARKEIKWERIEKNCQYQAFKVKIILLKFTLTAKGCVRKCCSSFWAGGC